MRRSGIRIMAELIGLIAPLIHIMILAVTAGVLGFLCAIFITILGGYAVLIFLGLSSAYTIKTIFISVLVLALLRGVFHYIEQLSNHFIAFKLLALIRDKIFKALRKLAPAKLEGRDKGNLIALITSDIELLEVFYAHTISPIAIGILTSIIMAVFIGSFNIMLGVIALFGYITIGFIIPYFSSKLGKDYGMLYRDNFGKLNSYFLDSLWGIKEILQFGIGDKRNKNIESKTDYLMLLNKKLKKYEGIISGLTSSAVLFFTLMILIVSIIISSSDTKLHFINIIIPVIAMASSFGPVIALSSLSNNLFMTLASGERVLNLLAEKPIIEEVHNSKERIEFDGAECGHIYFDYEGYNILNDYSLSIEPNKIIGISGKSGSGKSTLLKLFMRFWDIKSGSLEISNTNIKNINTDNLRELESYVTQDTAIFKDTIENNIKIADKNASHEEVIEACRKASIHDFIMTLPKGYDTDVEELGNNLSGGEKQRIGIARSFLHQAPFILLDEPTSNLDSLNEAVILKSIKDNSSNKTVLLVSHRLSTLNIADKVYKMKEDRVS